MSGNGALRPNVAADKHFSDAASPQWDIVLAAELRR